MHLKGTNSAEDAAISALESINIGGTVGVVLSAIKRIDSELSNAYDAIRELKEKILEKDNLIAQLEQNQKDLE